MATSGNLSNRPTGVNSLTGGVVTVTIASPAVDIQPDSQDCRSCIIQYYSGTQLYMNVDAAATAAKTSWLISKVSGAHLEYEIDNLNKLHFIGTAGDIVQILWRN